MFNLEQLDLENDRDLDKFEEYGRRVYETMSSASYRWAESLKGSLKEKASIRLISGSHSSSDSGSLLPVLLDELGLETP